MTPESEIKLPPQNLAAEQSVLRAMLLDNAVADDALAEMSADDIHSHANRIVFDTMLDLIREGKPASALTIADELERLGKLAEVGGWESLIQLLDSLPSAVTHEIGRAHV